MKSLGNLVILTLITLASVGASRLTDALQDLGASLAEDGETPESNAVMASDNELTSGDDNGGYNDESYTNEEASSSSSSNYDTTTTYTTTTTTYTTTTYTTTTTTTTYTTTTTRCYTYYEPYQEERCESYKERECRTTHKESCEDVPDKSCNALVVSKQRRKCFNVTEMICHLVEDVKYENIEEVYSIPKCHKVPDTVCDTVYEATQKSRSSYPCTTLETTVCKDEPYKIYDQVCRTYTDFECSYEDYGHVGAYAKGKSDDGKKSYCKKYPYNRCYQTPREVRRERCYPKHEKSCKRLEEKSPSARHKQVCHKEEKKVCTLEKHTRPKQVRKYVYTKKCVPRPKLVCESAQTHTLVPKCAPSTRKQCKYSPHKECKEYPKKYCYKITRKRAKQKCEHNYQQNDDAYKADESSNNASEVNNEEVNNEEVNNNEESNVEESNVEENNVEEQESHHDSDSISNNGSDDTSAY